MTDETQAPAIPRPRGRPPGTRTLRTSDVRAEPEVREEAVRPAKTRSRRAGSGADRLGVPREIKEGLEQDGVDIQWVTDSVNGMPFPHRRATFEADGWEAVTPDMFGGVFDGMFMRKEHQGEISFEGLVLMWRPLELTQEARQEERDLANRAVNIHEKKMRQGQLDGVDPKTLDPNHPSAKRVSHLTRQRVPGIPR